MTFLPILSYNNDDRKHWLHIEQRMKRTKFFIRVNKDTVRKSKKNGLTVRYDINYKDLNSPGVYAIRFVDEKGKTRTAAVGSNSSANKNSVRTRVYRFALEYAHLSKNNGGYPAARHMRNHYPFEDGDFKFSVHFISRKDVEKIVPYNFKDISLKMKYVELLFFENMNPEYTTRKHILHSIRNKKKCTIKPDRNVYDYV
jgi:hypothetical protein